MTDLATVVEATVMLSRADLTEVKLALLTVALCCADDTPEAALHRFEGGLAILDRALSDD